MVSGRRLTLAAALLVVAAASTTFVITRPPGHSSRENRPIVMLAYVAEPEGMPGWSAGVRRYLHAGVYLQPAEGGPARAALPVALTGPIEPLFALLSPDGRQLAVKGRLIDARNHTAGAGFVIWVMNLDGSGGHTVAAFPGASEVNGPDIGDMTWTPDSRKIVFTVITGSADLKHEAFRLWQANANGAPHMAPIPGTSGLDMPAYDPVTGTLIAVTTVSAEADRRREGLVLLKRGARSPVPLPGTIGATEPVFSPDGSKVAYLLRDDGLGPDPTTTVVVANADGTQPETVTTRGEIWELAFGPNGNLYYSERNGIDPSSLYSVPAQANSTPTRLSTIGRDVSSPSVVAVPGGGTPSSARAQPSTTPPSSGSPRPTAGALNLHTVDFENIAAPGASCFSARPIQLYDSLAYIPNRDGSPGNPITFDPSDRPYNQLSLSSAPVFGPLDSRGQEVAAVGLLCDNNGGTAAGQLLFSIAVYSGSSGRLRLLGLITPRLQHPHDHATLLEEPTIHIGVITIQENWYGPHDADCCPTGKAISTWTFRNGRLVPEGTTIGARPHSDESH